MDTSSRSLPLARFAFVDALRAVAATSVVLFHAVEGRHLSGLFSEMPSWLKLLLQHGDAGVAIFFVLSGFVIAHSLHGSKLTPMDAGRFIIRRSIRLDPPYWCAIVVTIAFSLVASAALAERRAETFTASQVGAHIFYLQDILHFKQINPVFWTLCLEVQFYIVFALLLLTRSQAVMCAGFAISLLWPLKLIPGLPGFFMDFWYGFLLGAGAYFAWTNAQARPWFFAYQAIVAGTTFYQHDVFGCVCSFTSLILFATAAMGGLTSLLNWQWLQYLGAISYSLYLLHNPITGAVFRIGYILTGRSTTTEAIWWAVSLACSIGAASVLWWAVERPSRKLSKSI